MTQLENWSRSYQLVIGVPVYEEDKYLLDASRIIKRVKNKFTKVDDTTFPLGSRVLSNLKSEGQSLRGFTFKLDSVRTISSTGNDNSEKTTLELFNIDQDLINILNTKGCIVRVMVGYGGRVELAYSGEVDQVTPLESGADSVYRIRCVDGLGSIKNTIGTLSYDETMSVKDIILDMADRFHDSSIGATGLAQLGATFVTGGLGFTGSLTSSFNMLLRRNNLSYGRFNGRIVILPHQIKAGDENSKEFTDTNFILSADLIKGLQPSNKNGDKTAEDSKELSGITISTFFIPIELGQFFTIPPEVNKTYAGTYQAKKIRTKLASQGNAWDVVVTGTKIE